jgi:hypothetical protein
MKTKVVATILGIVFCSAFLFATHVSADPAWYVCTIDRVGPSGSTVYVMVSDTAQPPAFTRKWCKCSDDLKNQMLAVGLTSMTNDQTISIRIDPALSYPTINNMYLNGE